MDVQKVLAQAEQFLKRGKLQEAVEKFESVLKEDPQNEVAANKLALTYIDLGQTRKATSLYCAIAKRASEKGKNQKALALYKQALTIDEFDPAVLNGLAEESEQLGKFSDAAKYSEQLVAYFLPRKRYLDIIAACARLVRCAPDNENIKLIWLEVVRILADESKLEQALVVFCGPPGLSSPEQQIGGDPTKIGQKVLNQLIVLQDWFPADPSLPYSLAWVAYRTGSKKSAYRFLSEAFRREPDYCLSALLLARLLVEDEKLTEAQFVFGYAKESISRDHRTNVKILTEQVSLFERANGWMAFNEGLSEGNLAPDRFLRRIRGEETDEEKANDEGNEKNADATYGGVRKNRDNEIALSPATADDETTEPADNDFEVTSIVRLEPGALQLSTSKMRIAKGPAADGVPAAPNFAEESDTDIEGEASEAHANDTKSRLTRMNDQLLEGIVNPPEEVADLDAERRADDDENTDTQAYSPQDLVQASKWDRAAQFEMDNQTIQVARQERNALLAQKEKNKQLQAEAEANALQNAEERESQKQSKIYSGLLGLAGLGRPKLKREDTGSIIVDSSIQNAQIAPDGSSPSIFEQTSLQAEQSHAQAAHQEVQASESPDFTVGDVTVVLQTRNAIPNPTGNVRELEGIAVPASSGLEIEKFINDEPTQFVRPPSAPSATATGIALPDLQAHKNLEFDKTALLRPAAEPEKKSPPKLKREFTDLAQPRTTVGYEGMDNPEGPSKIVPFTISAGEIARLQRDKASHITIPSDKEGQIAADPLNLGAVMDPLEMEAAEAPTMVFRPQTAEEAAKPSPLPEMPRSKPMHGDTDRGTDLLLTEHIRSRENPIQAPPLDPTKVFLDKIEETKMNMNRMLRVADEYLLEGNYYLARKACREAEALGANADLVNKKLKEIRKKEMPESFYQNFSNDSQNEKSKTKAAEVIRNLERDFSISFDNDLPNTEMLKSAKDLRPNIEKQLANCDSKLRIDLGVAFYEMGFYEEAENQFLNASNDTKSNFEAVSLAAQAMMARGNYEGAVQLLDGLMDEHSDKNEDDFLPVFYLLGESYAAMKESKKARKYFAKVSQINRNYRNVREKLSNESDG